MKHQKSEISQDKNKEGTDTPDSIFASGSGAAANNTFDCSLILQAVTVIYSPLKIISANISMSSLPSFNSTQPPLPCVTPSTSKCKRKNNLHSRMSWNLIESNSLWVKFLHWMSNR